MLIEREAIVRISSFLEPSDFHFPPHQTIYAAMLRLWDRREPADFLTVSAEILDAGDDNFSPGHLADLISAAEHPVHAEYYARRVKHRNLIRLAGIAADKGHYEDAGDYARDADRMLNREDQRIVPLSEMRSGFLRWRERDQSSTISTGFPSLDRLLGGGFRSEELIVVGARPSVGKTALAVSIFRHLTTQGRSVGFLSLEMQAEAILARLIAIETGRTVAEIRNAEPDSTVDRATGHVLNSYAESTSAIVSPPSNNLDTVLDLARELRFDHHVDAIIIDYLQYITPTGDLPPYQATTVVSKALKELARVTGVPVIVPAQLNRAVEASDRRPKLSDLRESGQIEQDADIVLLLHQPPEDEDRIVLTGNGPPPLDHPLNFQPTELIVAKNRNGETGIFTLQLVKRTTEFREQAYEPALVDGELF